MRQSGSEAYRGRRIISSEGCTERRDTKAGNYDDSVDGHDGTKGENRNPGAGPEGAEPGFRTREARGREDVRAHSTTVEGDAAFPAMREQS